MVISIITEVAKALGVKTTEELNAELKDIEIEPFTEKESTNDQEFAALLENIDFEHEIVDWSDTSVKRKILLHQLVQFQVLLHSVKDLMFK